MLRVTQLSGFGIASSSIIPGRVLARSGSYVLVGSVASVTKSTVVLVHKTLTATAGSYSLTGTAATLTKTGVWQTTYSKAFTTNQSGLGGMNIRQLLGAADLAFSGTKVRVTLSASTGAGFVLDHAAIGHAALSGDAYDFDGGQIALTFTGGSAGVTCAANATVLSDEMTFSLDETKNFIVAMSFTSGSTRIVNAAGTTRAYTKTAANEVLTTDVTGYGNLGFNWTVGLVEVRT